LNSEHKIFQSQDQLRTQLDKVERPLVFTNGCFDILHRGHVDYLEQAAQLGATLLVAVNSDESIRALGKGEDRPINSLADRLAVLAALGFIDLVIGFGEETPLELIRLCRPDRLVKGGDWPVSEIIGADLVQVSGVRSTLSLSAIPAQPANCLKRSVPQKTETPTLSQAQESASSAR